MLIKRPDMIDNNFNPNKIENLKPLWNNIEHRAKTVKGKNIGMDEQKLINLFKDYDIQLIYIGNSGFHLGHYFPDFISKDGTTLLEFIAKTNEEIQKRKEVYEKHGFNFLYIRTNWIRRKKHNWKILEYLNNNNFKIKNIEQIIEIHKKKRTSWSKGLRGEEYISHFKDGKIWNKGLTKETNESVMSISKNMIGNQNGKVVK